MTALFFSLQHKVARGGPGGECRLFFNNLIYLHFFPLLLNYTQLQLSNAGDRERLANGCGVEKGTMSGQDRPKGGIRGCFHGWAALK